jgi:hypothetical protein
LLAVPLGVTLTLRSALLTHMLAIAFFLVSITFVWRSFYKMRIEKMDAVESAKAAAGR